ncbi:MAG TPA: heme o synthase [Candidatus Baltobacteraceae bacterium]|jgi:protoheme IX farnesyltransferase|nr:heme o synthase [Candidatus Baltobacteraceae bacterium]
MKSAAQTLVAAPALVKAPVTEKPLPAILCELFKLRLTGLVLLTTLVGFYLGSRGPVSWVLMFHTLFGTALLASGAAALNQLIEREHDAKMRRTQDRPLPSGRLTPESVLVVGAACGLIGMIYLAAAVNLVTAALGAATLLSYVFVYTPLKRVTTLNTVIGAIPGALPPLMGWTAARGEISSEGWSLFAILCFWQLPHFLAIAWMYKDDYAKAGFVMLPVVDLNGERTGRQALCHTLGLLPISLCPFLFHMVGPIYLVGALILGILFIWCAFDFSRELTLQRARRLFFASIIYLPLLLSLMVIDKVRT